MRAPMRFLSSWRECGSSVVSEMETFYNLDCGDSNFVELGEGNDWEGLSAEGLSATYLIMAAGSYF